MKVVQVLPALELGGVERGTLEIAKGLVNAGHESLVISVGGRLVTELEASGSCHIHWDLGRKSLLTFLQVLPLRRWLEKEKPDIVHVRSRMPAWIVWLAWRGMDPKTRPRFITTLHGMHSVNKYSAIMGKGEKVIAVSETAKQYLLDNFPEVDPVKITVVHRGIDPNEFPRGFTPSLSWLEQFYSEYPQAKGKFLICFPGRITRWKGHLELVEIVEKLKGILPNLHVLIIGSDPKGSFLSEVKSAISTKSLEGCFSFLGTRSDMKELYAVSDVMLSLTTTTAEAFGRTVVECLSIGTPVVGYGHGAVKETLSALYPEGLVNTGDQDAVVSNLSALSKINKKNLNIEYGFFLDEMISKTLTLYESDQ